MTSFEKLYIYFNLNPDNEDRREISIPSRYKDELYPFLVGKLEGPSLLTDRGDSYDEEYFIISTDDSLADSISVVRSWLDEKAIHHALNREKDEIQILVIK